MIVLITVQKSISNIHIVLYPYLHTFITKQSVGKKVFFYRVFFRAVGIDINAVVL